MKKCETKNDCTVSAAQKKSSRNMKEKEKNSLKNME
jgi:hypothetical protein